MTLEIPFQSPPPDLNPVEGEVHVFCAPLEQTPERLEKLAETLSADERERAGRFHFGRDKKYFIAGRGILREILGWLLGVNPAELVFAYGDQGKPRLAGPVAEQFLHFNVAHSGPLAVVAVSRNHQVGIDVERIRPINEAEAIAARFFSEPERRQWRLLPERVKTEAFFNCWVRKEAVLKARGIGLGGVLNQVEVFFGGDLFNAAQGALRSLMPALNYTAAVAARCHAPCLLCWIWLRR